MAKITTKESGGQLATELGFKIKVLPSHALAENCAKFKETIDDSQTVYKKRLIELQKQMKADEVTVISAKTAGGQTYQFSVETRDDVVKVKRVMERSTPKPKKKKGWA